MLDWGSLMIFDGKFCNVPHVSRATAFFDSRQMVRNPVSVFEKYRARLGPTFSFHFGGTRPTLVSSDPAFIEQVLRFKRDNYHKSDIQVERMVEFQGRGLVNIHGDDWMRQRRLLAHGFLPKRLTQLLPMQAEVLKDLLTLFERDARQGVIDIHQQMVRFTLRMVGKSLFGRNMNEAELDQIAASIEQIQGFIVRQIVQPYLISWFRLSGQTKHYQQLRHAAAKIVLNHIAARRQLNPDEPDLLQLMLETPYPDTGDPMGDEQALIESLQLMVAGNETSSVSLTWIFYLLGKHPEYIAQIRAEIDAVIGEDPVNYENLHRLELTIRCVDEALRLYPPFWMIDRLALADDEICGIRIPAGTIVVPYIYGVHHNPDIWDDPWRFNPDRFGGDASKKRHSYAYIPFGGGPRICIGNNMAIMQILLIVVTLVRSFDFKLASNKNIDIQPMMLLRPEGAVPMQFTRR